MKDFFLLDKMTNLPNGKKVFCRCITTLENEYNSQCIKCGYRIKPAKIKKGFYNPDKYECQVLGNDFKTNYKSK